ncbi:hypothetical protein JCM18899A_16570 [Nocardioides sp. AN3]
MADRVVLHVGAMKSGTTSLQELMFADKARLAEQGILVPGQAWGDQARAVTEVARTWRADGELWTALVAEMADAPGTAVVSMEYLGAFAPPQIAAVVDSLGEAARVEVVITARDLNRSLVSMWQETIQNGRSWPWADYTSAVRRSRPHGRMLRSESEAGRLFWGQQDLGAMVRRWAAGVGDDAVTVVTLPPPGGTGTELTQRFARAVGFAPASATRKSANASLGLLSAVLLQRVNARLEAAGLDRTDGKRFRKRLVAKQILAARAAAEPRIGLPVASWVTKHTTRTVDGLIRAGTRLEGSWSDLTPAEVPGDDPAKVADAALTAVAAEAFATLRRHLADEAVASLPDWPAGADGDAAVAAFADLVAAGVRAGVTV